MSEFIIDWDENLVIDTFSKNSLREEIVRCRDCVNASFDEFGGGWCNENCREIKPWDYCAWDERRDK